MGLFLESRHTWIVSSFFGRIISMVLKYMDILPLCILLNKTKKIVLVNSFMIMYKTWDKITIQF